MENQRGKRHFEATLYFIIVCIAIALLYVWVLRLSEPVEEARFEYTLANLRSTVQVAELTAIAAGDVRRASEFHHTNPFELMETPSATYAGNLSDPAEARPGRWYFDGDKRELVYRVVNSPPGGPVFRRFQLRYRSADTGDGNPGRLHLAEQPQATSP